MRSGIAYFSKTLDSDNSSGKRSSVKKNRKESNFEIYVIPEAYNEDDGGSSNMIDKSNRKSRGFSDDKLESKCIDVSMCENNGRKKIQERHRKPIAANPHKFYGNEHQRSIGSDVL